MSTYVIDESNGQNTRHLQWTRNVHLHWSIQSKSPLGVQTLVRKKQPWHPTPIDKNSRKCQYPFAKYGS